VCLIIRYCIRRLRLAPSSRPPAQSLYFCRVVVPLLVDAVSSLSLWWSITRHCCCRSWVVPGCRWVVVVKSVLRTLVSSNEMKYEKKKTYLWPKRSPRRSLAWTPSLSPSLSVSWLSLRGRCHRAWRRVYGPSSASSPSSRLPCPSSSGWGCGRSSGHGRHCHQVFELVPKKISY
jgi:hypothetical protein